MEQAFLFCIPLRLSYSLSYVTIGILSTLSPFVCLLGLRCGSAALGRGLETARRTHARRARVTRQRQGCPTPCLHFLA